MGKLSLKGVATIVGDATRSESSQGIAAFVVYAIGCSISLRWLPFVLQIDYVCVHMLYSLHFPAARYGSHGLRSIVKIASSFFFWGGRLHSGNAKVACVVACVYVHREAIKFVLAAVGRGVASLASHFSADALTGLDRTRAVFIMSGMEGAAVRTA